MVNGVYRLDCRPKRSRDSWRGATIGLGVNRVYLRAGSQNWTGPRRIRRGVIIRVLAASVLLHWLLTIDAPLTFAWTASLYFLWRAIETDFKKPSWALALLVTLFLGNLSKQMMLVFYPLTILFIAFEPARRSIFRRCAFWVTLGLSLLALVPPLVWNANHGWVTFEHTAGHFTPDTADFSAAIGRFGSFLGAFLGVASPITGVLMLLVLVEVTRKWRQVQDSSRFLWWFSAPPLFAIAILSFDKK